MKNHSTVETAKEMLNDWLSKGVVPPGGKLPSERELEEMMGVHRMTIHNRKIRILQKLKKMLR